MKRVPLGAQFTLTLLAGLAAACGGSSGSGGQSTTSGPSSTPDPTPTPTPTPTPPTPTPPTPTPTGPVTKGDWTYYGTGDGITGDVHDVSADEAGNVYVAGGDAVYVKRRADKSFLRFDSANAGLTVNCNDQAQEQNETPTTPFFQCPILSVAGATAGRAVIGFDGFQTETTGTPQWDWVLLGNGGADVVAFDAAAGKLSRVRHVDLGSPPHVICAIQGGNETRDGTCSDPGNGWWVGGRHLVHRVLRIVVNHDTSSPMYGDTWMCGHHGTFTVLLANAAARHYKDHTAGVDPKYADEKDVWEHLHPALVPPSRPTEFVNGECTALSIDPGSGIPWGSNRYRTVHVTGYGADLSSEDWWMGPTSDWYDLWTDPSPDDLTSNYDDVSSMSHCADGSLWVGSLQHGLARIGTDGKVAFLSLPDASLGNSVSAVACDPKDSSLWIGLGRGGVMRLRNGAFEPVDTTGLPSFTNHPVDSIQIDRWASTRIVYFAFQPTTGGTAPEAGGVGAYAGP